MENAYIYGLSDPRDGRIRYIGRTRQSFARRLTGHCCSKFLRGNSRREQWITSLTSSGQKPFIQFLECVPGNGFDAERKWIAKYREMGHDLTNSTDGGAGHSFCGLTQRQLLSAYWKPKGLNPGLKKAVEGRIGTRQSAETIARRMYSRNVKGAYRPSEETKRKCVESNLRTWSDPELLARNKVHSVAGAKKMWSQMTPERLKIREEKRQKTLRENRGANS